MAYPPQLRPFTPINQRFLKLTVPFVVLALLLVIKRLFVSDLRRWLTVPAYAIGGV